MRLTALALFSLTAALAGCSSAPLADQPPAEPSGPRPTASFERSVTPFPVLDLDGTPYAHPFLGGLDVPRPQFVDIDADGDADLFVQEHTSRLIFFENVGTPTAPKLVWRTDAYAGLDVGEWYRFGDLDADGDLDLLGETPFSYLRLFRNEGTAQDARWTLAADSLAGADGQPLFSDRQNIPNLVDIDADGHMDLFVGRLDGTVSRFEIVDPSAPIPRFELRAQRFEDIEIVSQFGLPGIQEAQPTGGPTGWVVRPENGPRPTTMHGANTMTWADADGDGDFDLLWGDYFEPSLLLLRNEGTPTQPSLRGEPIPYPILDPVQSSGYNAPTVADLDGNGELDLLVGVLGGAFDPQRTSRSNLWFYDQDGTFDLQTKRFLHQIDVGSESTPALGDVDGDGDLDLLVASKSDPDADETGRVWLYRNDGTAHHPSYQAAGVLSVGGAAFHLSPALGDLDGDGRDDLVVGTWRTGLRLLMSRDDGWALVDSLDVPRGSHATPALADLDGDGDLDLIAGTSRGTLVRYENVGTPTAPRFADGRPIADIDIGRRAQPALADLDADGLPDLVVSGFDSVAVYRMTPERTFEPADLLDFAGVHLPPQATFALGDVTGDGRPDAVVGGRSGGVQFLRGRD
jgi:hypothetical protein